MIDMNNPVAMAKEIATLRKALAKCREEFCWHANTRKSLSQPTYCELVDMIDEALGEPVDK